MNTWRGLASNLVNKNRTRLSIVLALRLAHIIAA